MFKEQLEEMLKEFNSFSDDREALFYSFVKERLETELDSYNTDTSSSLEFLSKTDSLDILKEMTE